MHTYFDLQWILLAAVLVCKVSKKDRSVAAVTNDDVDPVSRAQYIAVETIKIKGYGHDMLSFWR